MKALVLAGACLLMLGCGAVSDMGNMFEKQAQVQRFVKDKRGWTVQAGWNIHNGVLTQVTVVFYASEVGDQSVATLDAVVREAVAASFESAPRVINIQVTSAPIPKTG